MSINPITVDQYNDDVDKNFKKTTQLLIKWKTILIRQNTSQSKKFNRGRKKTNSKILQLYIIHDYRCSCNE